MNHRLGEEEPRTKFQELIEEKVSLVLGSWELVLPLG
jgi:hypothetical protein